MTVMLGIITDVGKKALSDAVFKGDDFIVDKVKLSSNIYDVDRSLTDLAGVIKVMALSSSKTLDPGRHHINITDSTKDSYTLGSVGLYTNGNILFCYLSDPSGPLSIKTQHEKTVLSYDIVFDTSNADKVTIQASSQNINLSLATELASLAEAIASNQKLIVERL